MRQVDVGAIDLNLLRVLHALLLERHVTRAAKRIHMSQPAVSRALSRLRRTFDDELLVRVGQQMQPTAKAAALMDPLQRILSDVRALVTHEEFTPSRADGVVRLAAPDIIAYMLGPGLMRRLGEEAPRVDLEIVQWSSAWREQLASGAVDLTIGQTVGTERGVYTSPLVRNTWATVLRRRHPALRKRWSIDTFTNLSHLMIGFSSQGGGQVDVALANLGRSRRVALRLPYVLLSPMIIAETDLVLTTARWLAEKLAPQLGLVVKTPPVELAPVDLPMVWHERSHRDPKQRWLRQLLTDVAREQGMSPPRERRDAT